MTERDPGRTLLVGCGKLGTLLGDRLVAQGSAVTAVRRRAEGLPDAFSAVEADLRMPFARSLGAFDSMVITLPPEEPASAGASPYRTALTHLAAALPAKPERVVFVSSTRVFEGRPGAEPLTERDAPAPASARADELLTGEGAAVELFAAAVVRPAGIYGPGRDSLIRRVAAGAPVDRTRRTNRIHETDLVRLLEALLRAEEPPRLLHAVDRAPVPLGEVVDHIATRLGLPSPPDAGGNGGGTVLDGSLAAAFLGELRYPTFREGYDELTSAVR